MNENENLKIANESLKVSKKANIISIFAIIVAFSSPLLTVIYQEKENNKRIEKEVESQFQLQLKQFKNEAEKQRISQKIEEYNNEIKKRTDVLEKEIKDFKVVRDSITKISEEEISNKIINLFYTINGIYKNKDVLETNKKFNQIYGEALNKYKLSREQFIRHENSKKYFLKLENNMKKEVKELIEKKKELENKLNNYKEND